MHGQEINGFNEHVKICNTLADWLTDWNALCMTIRCIIS